MPVTSRPSFHNSSPTLLKCYCLAFYYIPTLVEVGGFHFDKSPAQSYRLTVAQAFLFPAVTLFHLVACFLPSLVYTSGADGKTLEYVMHFLEAWVVYTALLVRLVTLEPSLVVLLGCFCNIHVLYTMATTLDGIGRRVIVGGSIARTATELLILVLPVALSFLGGHVRTHPKDLVLVVFTPELYGIVVDVFNSVCDGILRAFTATP
ncbi:hypothetical protein GUITHDRAFT_145995 [Guillardia theta CCMP2712]|uniref:Uncharacterized protein n=1 Tax=Guillardia theta (strain CCMP2712) TaxID=905079 RepID=L1IJT0_GUITC|nr:hypothetical protein GUITHDRAFT_146945 [Guillardia theta CCMP2712]XP_005823164.1 hypothetical protein GUITHDRAFT_145995 [Guillardia theta CCMP2712]EKX34839.1 hypothetical protein GUITHDRAFT_146945 [Guillardia theta CCMP2712]EKX36184.1 hypothetical protein GUITHDRAFT_145995 [Guillardia theta CCMP2712]|eukprot:XP_005821819.1 hypothetical protein GUITHDRAFT_146945 [Guillardia theta CCMP2712]